MLQEYHVRQSVVSFHILIVFALQIVNFKAFALTGRLYDCYDYPGRCPGLGAYALSGRIVATGYNSTNTNGLLLAAVSAFTNLPPPTVRLRLRAEVG